jgi:hypothetical protein
MFDESIEARELHSACMQVSPTNPGLFAACKKFRR